MLSFALLVLQKCNEVKNTNSGRNNVFVEHYTPNGIKVRIAIYSRIRGVCETFYLWWD